MDEQEKKKYESIFQDALGLLIKHHPFFGHVLSNVVRIDDEKIRTMGVSVNKKGQVTLRYNLKMVKHEMDENKLPLKKITAMVQHEIYHIINEHFKRRDKDKYNAWIVTPAGPQSLFNICADIAINQFIDDLPDWVYNLDSFEGIDLPKEDTLERYYAMLVKQAKQNAKDNNIDDLGDATGVMFFDGSDESGESSGKGDGKQGQGGNKKGKSKSGNGDKKQKEKGKDEDGQGQGSGKQSQLDKIKEYLPFKQSDFEKKKEEMKKEGKFNSSKEEKMPGDHDWEETGNIPEEMVHQSVKQIVKEAYNKCKFGGQGIGNMPAGVERMCEETLKPAYDFRPILKRFVDGEVFSKYVATRKRPNRRFGYEYPGKKTETKAKIGVIADTSGSMYNEDMALIAKNLRNIDQYVQVVLFDVDSAIHDVREYNKRNFDNILKGGGGTNFDSVFKLVDNVKRNKHLLNGIPENSRRKAFRLVRNIKALICMTDGGVYVDVKPKIPVMWALTSRCFNAPVEWGKVIYLDNDPDKHRGY